MKLLDDTGLVFRAPEKGPGTHALLIGVSSYPYLRGGDKEKPETYGLGQIDSAARTVHDLAAWLVDHKDQLRAPLQSCRVLASPSPAEVSCAPAVAGLLPAKLDNVMRAIHAWRDDATDEPASGVWLYFAGHGFQRSRGDQVLLLEDFLGGYTLLDRAINTRNLYNGMWGPSLTNVARNQLYVIDACRANVSQLKNFVELEPVPVFDFEWGGEEWERNAPIIYASAPGGKTFGSMVAGGRSAFGDDFIRCLENDAGNKIIVDGESRWAVTIGRLSEILDKLARMADTTRSVIVDSFRGVDEPLLYLDGPPTTTCSFFVQPDEACSVALLNFVEGNLSPPYTFPTPIAPNPHIFQAPAGNYSIGATVPDPHKPKFRDVKTEVLTVLPPRFEYSFRMGLPP
jgi:hypothetical protein